MKFDYNQPILDLMIAWVSNNIDVLNAKMVLCAGDPEGHIAFGVMRMPEENLLISSR